MEGTSTKEDLLSREIEDLHVVSSIKYHPVTVKNKVGYHDNLMCYTVSSHPVCTDGDCKLKQVGPIHMSRDRPTMLDCFHDLKTQTVRDHDPKFVAAAQA